MFELVPGLADLSLVSPRFGQIASYGSDEFGTVSVHILWLEHAAKILQEGHHPCELFCTEMCEDIDACAVVEKVSVNLDAASLPSTGDNSFFMR